MKNTLRLIVLIGLLFTTAGIASAQVATGTTPFGSFGGGPDTINLANLNAHLTIPVLQKAGRRIPFSYDITYDSSVWQAVGGIWEPTNAGSFGWSYSAVGSLVAVSSSSGYCYTYYPPPYGYIPTGEWSTAVLAFIDRLGTSHVFPGEFWADAGTCSSSGSNSWGYSGGATVLDGSGYTLGVNTTTGSLGH